MRMTRGQYRVERLKDIARNMKNGRDFENVESLETFLELHPRLLNHFHNSFNLILAEEVGKGHTDMVEYDSDIFHIHKDGKESIIMNVDKQALMEYIVDLIYVIENDIALDK